MENTQNNMHAHENMHAHDNMCGCGMQTWMGSRYSAIRIVRYFLMFVILTIVLCVGMQIGELKGMLRSSGYGMHDGYSMRGANMMYQGDMPMMRQVQLQQSAPAAANQ